MKINNKLVVGSVVNNFEIYNKFLEKSLSETNQKINALIIDNLNNIITNNIASIYNSILRTVGSDIKVFLHPDTSFERDFFKNILECIQTFDDKSVKWGALGIVGRSFDGDYIWGHEIDHPVKVCCLDSCSLITRSSFNMVFDQVTFNGFHLFIEDYCLQCQMNTFEVYVIPVKAYHASATMRTMGSQWGEYRKYRKKLDKKWRKRFETIYTC